MNEYLEWLNKATVLFLCLCIHTQMTCIFVFMYSRNENIKEPVQCVWCRSYFSNLADIPSLSRAGLSSSLFWTLSPLPALFLRYNHLFLVFIIPSGNEGEIIRLDLHNIHILLRPDMASLRLYYCQPLSDLQPISYILPLFCYNITTRVLH